MQNKYKNYPRSLLRWGRCGKGLSSIFLGKEFGVHVYAVDPEIPVDTAGQDSSDDERRKRTG